jgi:hypothetical protein
MDGRSCAGGIRSKHAQKTRRQEQIAVGNPRHLLHCCESGVVAFIPLVSGICPQASSLQDKGMVESARKKRNKDQENRKQKREPFIHPLAHSSRSKPGFRSRTIFSNRTPTDINRRFLDGRTQSPECFVVAKGAFARA